MKNHLSIASLIGRIRNIRFVENKRCEFNLRSDRGGLFYVKASGAANLAACKALKENDMVYVLSHPPTFFYRKCRREHVYFEAITILPVADTDTPDPDYDELLQTVIIEALKGYFDDNE